jgi:catechol 1,2-dioxygenase
MQALSIDTLTDTVVDAMGPKTSPRVREVMSSLIRHVHDFAREVNLTTDEWLAGLEMLVRAGKMSDDKRNEMILVSDIIGLESLVDALDNKADGRETESAVLGPFYRENAPILPAGSSIVRGGVPGETVLVSGRVTSSSGEPLVGATLDIWETSPNGLYEQQDANQPDMNLRGRFVTDSAGKYAYRALRPVSYPIPYDGPAGDLLQLMDRHPYRPAHIHLIVSAPGHRSLVTQIFDRTDKYLGDDSVFAVKNSLIVDFEPAPPGADTDYVVTYDVCLKAEPARQLAAV